MLRVTGQGGEAMGIMSLSDALRIASEMDVDLVEIAAMASPPVALLIDYGKFKYREQKRAQDAKSKQKIIEIKEIKFRPGTDDGDYNIKVRNIRRFLEGGDKCKITLRFRGREMAHQEIGVNLLNRIREDLGDEASVESMPRLEGRQMIMMLAQGKKRAGVKPKAVPAQVKESQVKIPVSKADAAVAAPESAPVLAD